MRILVTSAAGANGDGHGALLGFDGDGNSLGSFCGDPRITDPRGLAVDDGPGLLFVNSGSNRILAIDAQGTVVRDSGPIDGLNPGGSIFGPDRRYYVGLRNARTIMAFAGSLDVPGEDVLPPGIVPFPRGFAFGHDGRLFLASGIGPNGAGDDTIAVFSSDGNIKSLRLVHDPDLSPLDLIIAPNGNILVTSERPFGAPDAITSVREYDPDNGRLVRVFSPDGQAQFRRPRGLRFGPDGNLYCVAQDEVVVFDFARGRCLGCVVRFPRLHGQAVAFF